MNSIDSGPASPTERDLPGMPPPSSREEAARTRRERALAALLLAGLLALGGVFLSPALRGRIPVWGDLARGTLPMRVFYQRCLQQGQAYDWMPELYGGYFVSGAGGQGLYHPVNLLLYRFLPLDLAFALEVFWPVAMLALGMVVFLRRYLSLVGACMGSFVASFSLLFVLYLHTPPMTAVLAHIPWFLAALDMTIAARTPARRWFGCAAIALVNGSQVLQGFPQALWFSLLSGALFSLCMLIMRRAPWQAWLAVVAGAVLGICIGAAELLSMYSMFLTSAPWATDRALLPYPPIDPWSFRDAFVPDRTWYGSSQSYFGAAPLVLVLWWVTAWRTRVSSTPWADAGDAAIPRQDDDHRQRRVRQLTCWAFLIAVVTALLSMGLKAKLYYLQLWLPIVGSFRSPFRIFIVTQFSVGILTGLAFDRLVRLVATRQSSPRRHLVLPWAGVVVAVVLAVWFHLQADSQVARHWQLAAGPLLIGGSALALTLAARGRSAGLALLILITIGDLAHYSVDTINGRRLWHDLPTYEQLVAQCSGPPTATEGRLLYVDRRDGWGSAVNLFYLGGYRTINGYSGLYPVRRLDYTHLNSLRVAEVAWVWQPGNSSLPPVLGSPQTDGTWSRVPGPLPRVRLVGNVRSTAWPAEDLKRINVDDTALVSRPIELAPSQPGETVLLEDLPGRIAVEVKAPQRQLLVISESYQDGWQVRIDGQPAVLEQVNGDFFGCVVEAGEHRAEFEFSPLYVRCGRWITLASLALALGMILIAGFGLLRQRDAPSSI